MLRIMPMLRAAAAFAVVALTALLVLPVEPALAQAATGGGESAVVMLSIAELILGALGTVAVPTALAIWALIKARAAQSEATWDDWMVAMVEQTARRVLNQAAAPPAAEPLDLRGRLGGGGGA